MIHKIDPSTAKSLLFKRRGMILGVTLLGTMALPFLMPMPTAHANNDRREDSDQARNPDALLGTWIVEVSLDPATVPPGTTLQFTQLVTYGAGGGFVESNNGPNSGGPGGQGNWTRTGHHQFASTQVRLEFDAAHNFTGSNKVRSSLRLGRKGDEFTGSYQVDLFLPDGTLLPFHPAGTSHGIPMAIEPLN